jgi:hypothetical protein
VDDYDHLDDNTVSSKRLRTSFFGRGGGGNMTVPTDRHETYGPSQDYGMSRDQRRAIYSSLTLDSLYSLVLDSQLYSISVSGL